MTHAIHMPTSSRNRRYMLLAQLRMAEQELKFRRGREQPADAGAQVELTTRIAELKDQLALAPPA